MEATPILGPLGPTPYPGNRTTVLLLELGSADLCLSFMEWQVLPPSEMDPVVPGLTATEGP